MPIDHCYDGDVFNMHFVVVQTPFISCVSLCVVCKSPIALPPYGKLQASSEKIATPIGDPATSGSASGACSAEDGYIITNTGWCAKHDNG